MKIEILGTGCPKCETLGENAKVAADKLGIEYEIEKITNITEIARRGVMITPALSIDGQVMLSGKVATEGEIVTLLREG